MRSLEEIYALAATRKGGAAALQRLIEKPRPKAELLAISDHRWFSAMAHSLS